MKIICPKCQYENQADSARIVCARCATIIEVKQDQGASFEGNGKRQTARLPFVGNVGNSQPLNNPPATPNRDVYATRIGDDFDDVLDIPRQTQPTGYQASNEPTTAFEDVFAMPSYDAPANYDFPPQQEKKPTAPIEGFATGQNRQRETQDYGTTPEPEFMGWPVLPENTDDDQEPIGGFSSNRGALLIRVALGIVVFGLLSFLAYYFLGDKIAKRQIDYNKVTENTATTGQAGTTPNYPPATVPSPEPKPAEVKPPTANNSNTAAVAPTNTAQQPENKPQPPTQSNGETGKQVVIEPITGKQAHSSVPTPTTPSNGNLTLQVASFNDQAQASERVTRLRQMNVEARVVKAEIPGKGTWYRVQIGGFKSREEATNYANQLKGKGALQDYIITSK